MGCCFSRPSGPNSPYPAAQQSTNYAAPPPPPLSPLPPPATTTSSSSPPSAGTPRHRHHRRPLAQHITKPLRRHIWTSAAPPSSSAARRQQQHPSTWTRAALDAERAAFFDTRVSGRVEVWLTVRAALEVLWAAERGDNDAEVGEAVATAQSILTAAGVTLPTGDLADGVYDGLGNWYQLPEYVVADPVDMVAEEEEEEGRDGRGEESDEEEEEEEEEEDEEEMLRRRRREEKGKGVVDRRSQVVVVVRLSDGAKDLKLMVGKEETVRSVVRRVREETGHPPATRIRIVYFGKILRDNGTLLEQGWTKGNVLSGFVYDPPS